MASTEQQLEKISPELLDLIGIKSTRADFGITGGVDAQPQDLYLTNGDQILIEIRQGKAQRSLIAELKSAGLRSIRTEKTQLSGWIGVESIANLADISGVSYVRPIYKPITRSSPLAPASEGSAILNTGRLTSEGDQAQRSDVARSLFTVSGEGIEVGVLSDSFDSLSGYSTDISTGDLPSGIKVLEDLGTNEGSDEGRAMLQIIHDIAPKASLAFRTAFRGANDFANGIRELAAQGSKIIVDDVGYLTEPFFQDGVIAQAVNDVSKQGVAYFSSIGNNSMASYQSAYRPSGIKTASYEFHDFNGDPGSTDIFQNITLSAGQEFKPSLQWDQPFGSISAQGASSKNDLDIFILSAPSLSTGTILARSTIDNLRSGDPSEILSFRAPSNGTYYLAVGQFLTAGGPQPSLFKYIDFGSGAPVEYATNSSTAYGHPTAAGGLGVAASAYFQTPAFGVSPPRPRPFTSLGGTPIIFDESGRRLETPEFREQPGVTAPDGVSTTVPGFRNFAGTSAAAPSAAAVAALLMEKVPSASNKDIYDALRDSALDMSTPGYDLLTGAGLIQADKAIELLTKSVENNDSSAPLLVSTSPEDNARDVPIDASIALVFSEAVRPGNGSILIEKSVGNDPEKRILINDDSQVSFDGSRIIIDPVDNFDFSSDYSIQIESGAIEDLASNPFGGLRQDLALDFRTEDPDFPEISIQIEEPKAVREDSSTNLVFVVTRSGGDTSKRLIVEYALSGSATPVGNSPDFLVNGEQPDGRQIAIFEPFNETSTIEIDPIADTAQETDETVRISLQQGTDYIVNPGLFDSAEGVIINDDTNQQLIPTRPGRPARPTSPGRPATPGRPANPTRPGTTTGKPTKRDNTRSVIQAETMNTEQDVMSASLGYYMDEANILSQAYLPFSDTSSSARNSMQATGSRSLFERKDGRVDAYMLSSVSVVKLPDPIMGNDHLLTAIIGTSMID